MSGNPEEKTVSRNSSLQGQAMTFYEFLIRHYPEVLQHYLAERGSYARLKEVYEEISKLPGMEDEKGYYFYLMNMGPLKILSHILSVYTIGSCIFLKIPQIKTAREKQTAVGLQLQPLVLEVSSYTVTGLYNYSQGHALMTWLEYPIIIVQVYILIFYYLLFTGKLHNKGVRVCIATYFGATLGFILNIIPQGILGWLVPLCTPVGNLAKALYVWNMVSKTSSENVSLATWGISFSTNFSRLFTVWVDSCDKRLMWNFAVSSTMSLAVLTTAAFYKFMKTKPVSTGEAKTQDTEDKATNTDNKDKDPKDKLNNPEPKEKSKNQESKWLYGWLRNGESKDESKKQQSKDKSANGDTKDKARRRKNTHED